MSTPVSPLVEHSRALADLVERAAPSVPGLRAGRHHGGTALTVTRDDTLVTAAHALGDASRAVLVRQDGSRVEARVLGVDPARDLAVLKADAPVAPPLVATAAAEVRTGSLVLALGRPGVTVRARLGVLSAVGPAWTAHGGARVDAYLESDAGRAPGFSGGPLLAMDGTLVGMNTSALSRGTLVALPPSTLVRVVEEITAHGRIRRAWLGVAMQPTRLHPVPAELQGHSLGLLITQVETDSPAARAGVLVGDILVSLGDDGEQTLEELQALLSGDNIGQEHEARILRGGHLVRVKITLGAR